MWRLRVAPPDCLQSLWSSLCRDSERESNMLHVFFFDFQCPILNETTLSEVDMLSMQMNPYEDVPSPAKSFAYDYPTTNPMRDRYDSPAA